MGGVFCKNVENGGVFCKKSGKWGRVFFVKKWTFPQRRVHYVQYQYFYFTFYLFGKGVRRAYAPNAPPAYGSEAVRFDSGWEGSLRSAICMAQFRSGVAQ